MCPEKTNEAVGHAHHRGSLGLRESRAKLATPSASADGVNSYAKKKKTRRK